MQFCSPKPLGRRSLHWISSCHLPSTKNRYWCSPGSRGTVAFQVPSFCFFNEIGLWSQAVKSPTNITFSADGAKYVNACFFAAESFLLAAAVWADWNEFFRPDSISVDVAVRAMYAFLS